MPETELSPVVEVTPGAPPTQRVVLTPDPLPAGPLEALPGPESETAQDAAPMQVRDSKHVLPREMVVKLVLAPVLVALILLPGFEFPAYFRVLATLLFLAMAFLGVRTLFTTAVSLRRYPDPAPMPDGPLPFVSVIIPARDEANVLERTMESMQLVDYPRDRLEFIYVHEATSSDGTGDIIRRWAARDPRYIDLQRPAVHRPGKAAAFNDALRQARGDVVLGLDADQSLRPDALRRVVQWFACEPDLAAVKARPIGINARESMLAFVTQMERNAVERGDTYARQRFGGFTFFGGGQVAFRRSDLEALGGYSEDILLEDMDLSFRIHAASKRIRVDPGLLTYEEHPARLRDWWSQRHRWSRGGLQVARRHLPRRESWRRLPWRARVDFLQTFAFALFSPLFVLLLPLGLLERLGVHAGTYIPAAFETAGWALIIGASIVAWVALWFVDRMQGIRHARAEWLGLPLMGAYATLYGLVLVSAFLDEFILQKPSVFVKTHKSGAAFHAAALALAAPAPLDDE
jgi:cellulose synthase/poly-beta-1,6-N-acetylglucosamine synthase-like glycosyltransferase